MDAHRARAAARAAKILRLYAVILIVGGFAGFAMSGFAAKAKSALIMGARRVPPRCALRAALTRPPRASTAGTVSSALVFGCSTMANSSSPRTVAIGVHASMLLALVFAGVFAWRASISLRSPEKRYAGALLVGLSVASAHALVSLVLAKPKSPAKPKTK